jgi:glycosyltransferase involved in cell wall biosynthesis
MSDRPEISVVIPTRDRLRLLKRALAGALRQHDVQLEVIVVDDGSVDGTTEAIESLTDHRIRVVRNETPRGVACARNRGMSEARGFWVSFLDDDDLWSPSKLRTQLDAAVRADASFVFGAGLMVDERLCVLRAFAPPDPEGLARTLGSLNAIPVGCSNVIARLDLVRTLGGFDESLCQLADWDLWYRLACTTTAAATPEAVVAYVMHPQNMLLTHEPDVMDEFRYFAGKVADRDEDAPVIDSVRFSRWVAGGHLRAGRKRRAARVLLEAGVAQRDVGNIIRGLATPLGARGMLAYWRLRKGRQAAPQWLELYRSTAELS